jgi:glutathione synthase/RimK-type ligase-like ATP-grasp enzyme
LSRLAVAASSEFPDLRDDWPLLRAALAERGIDATTQVWDDPDANWKQFDLVVANGAWDNIHRPDEFLAWADEVGRIVRIVNSSDTLRWNHNKRYLAELASAGCVTVPTTWVETGTEVEQLSLPSGEFVVKPTISGGGYQTARYGEGEADHAEARGHIAHLLDEGRSVMVQPYQSAVDVHAEVGLIFLGGEYSHAIRKGALLPPGTRATKGLYTDEVITPAEPSTEQRAVAAETLRVAEGILGPTTYARVDLVPTEEGGSAVLELELLDPALFFDHHPPGAARFAEVLSALIAGS